LPRQAPRILGALLPIGWIIHLCRFGHSF
jgi:hypothetical protein